MTKLCLLFALLQLAACLPLPGDGAFMARGSILHESDSRDSCQVLLVLVDDNQVLYRRDVSGEYTAEFVVAPYKETYIVKAVCGGVVKQEIVVEYGKTVAPGGVVSIPPVIL